MKRTPLRPRRTPLRRVGRIGRENLAFSQRMLAKWYAEGMDAGRSVGERRVKVMAFDVWAMNKIGPAHRIVYIAPDVVGPVSRIQVEAVIEQVERNGQPYYVGHNVQVGHKPGYAKAQEPKHRWNPEAVEPQTIALNRYYNSIGGGRKGEGDV